MNLTRTELESTAVSLRQRDSTAPTQRNGDIQDYFAPGRRSGESKLIPTLDALDLKLPSIRIAGLTPSQRVFSIATGLNLLSLAITSGDEYFLFMNLRAEHLWASYNMTSAEWAEATDIYNSELKVHN